NNVNKVGMPINLDHHQVPDPVGKAIGCLLDRISELEHELKLIQGLTAKESTVESVCQTCDDTCSQPTFSLHPRTPTGA
ncbi:MAG TPA: hypothetical protein VFH49_07710, partial [Aquabacterium sp.]|nr:hypothetical protein [Aquabacterium sp.]